MTRQARRLGTWLASGALSVGAVLGGSGCADPELTQPAQPTIEPTTPGASPPDPRDEELAAELEALRATLTAAHDALEQARQATELPAARAGAEDAVHALTAAPSYADDLDGDGEVRPVTVEPLLPGPADAIPEDAFYGDQFSRTLTAARNAGGAGGRVVDALRDPIVGDIGVWAADAGAVLDQVEDASRAAGLDAVEAAVQELPGHATKALAYALTAARARELAVATGAAERGLAHLDITLAALEDLAPRAPDAGAGDG